MQPKVLAYIPHTSLLGVSWPSYTWRVQLASIYNYCSIPPATNCSVDLVIAIYNTAKGPALLVSIITQL